MSRRACLLLLALLTPLPLAAAEHPSLVKARALYNAADFDAAIGAAALARADPASADAAALVAARSYLEKFRLQTSDPADLVAARELLKQVHGPTLSPRDQVDLLVGLGQALYLADTFGAAAELFDNALARASLLSDRDRSLLLDWWATSIDREAQSGGEERRMALLGRVMARMDEELQRDPANGTANYWLAVAARGAGDHERAWDAAVAGWVRAVGAANPTALRDDIDRFVTTVLIPERARARPPREQQAAVESMRAEWDTVKEQWK